MCVNYLEYKAHYSKICVYITFSIKHTIARSVCTLLSVSCTRQQDVCTLSWVSHTWYVHYLEYQAHESWIHVYITLSIMRVIAISVCTLPVTATTWWLHSLDLLLITSISAFNLFPLEHGFLNILLLLSLMITYNYWILHNHTSLFRPSLQVPAYA